MHIWPKTRLALPSWPTVPFIRVLSFYVEVFRGWPKFYYPTASQQLLGCLEIKCNTLRLIFFQKSTSKNSFFNACPNEILYKIPLVFLSIIHAVHLLDPSGSSSRIHSLIPKDVNYFRQTSRSIWNGIRSVLKSTKFSERWNQSKIIFYQKSMFEKCE